MRPPLQRYRNILDFALSSLLRRKADYASAAAAFNASPKKGVAALEAALGTTVTPKDVACFLRFGRGLDKAAVSAVHPTRNDAPRSG